MKWYRVFFKMTTTCGAHGLRVPTCSAGALLCSVAFLMEGTALVSERSFSYLAAKRLHPAHEERFPGWLLLA